MPETIIQFNAWKDLFQLDHQFAWESHVTFNFPSSVALLDVLSSDEFPTGRRSLLRRVEVFGSPIPIMAPDDSPSMYVPHELGVALPFITGLRLDTLIYKDAYRRDGDPGRSYLSDELTSVSMSCGWHKLIFTCTQELVLDKNEIRTVETQAARIRQIRDEQDFELVLPERSAVIQDLTCDLNSLDLSSASVAIKSPETQRPIRDNLVGRDMSRVSGRRHRYMVMMAVRGKSADVLPNGKPFEAHSLLHNLLESMSWMDLRYSGAYLMEEGLDDPNSHL